MTVDAAAEGKRGALVTLPARPEPIRVAADETAVIVVDMQNAYASPGGYLDLAGFDIGGAARVIEQTAKVLETARAAGLPVIYFQNGWDEDYVEAGGPGSPNWHKSNALKTMRARPELQGKLLARGGWDYELVEALAPQPGDIVLPKTRYSRLLQLAARFGAALARHPQHRASSASPPTSASNRPCATASSSNISGSCSRTRPTRPGPNFSRRPASTMSRPSSAGSRPSPISAAPSARSAQHAERATQQSTDAAAGCFARAMTRSPMPSNRSTRRNSRPRSRLIRRARRRATRSTSRARWRSGRAAPCSTRRRGGADPARAGDDQDHARGRRREPWPTSPSTTSS